MKKTNSKKGFILSYSVVIMTFVTMLIATALTLMQTCIKLGKASVESFRKETEFAQIQEFFEAQGQNGYLLFNTVDSKYYYAEYDYTSNATTATLTVLDCTSGRVCLYEEKNKLTNEITYKNYGEKEN